MQDSSKIISYFNAAKKRPKDAQNETHTVKKRPRLELTRNEEHEDPPLGVKWSNMSCAYDSTLVILSDIYRASQQHVRDRFASQNVHMRYIFDQLRKVNEGSMSFEHARNRVRAHLREYDPRVYPPPGDTGTDLFSLCRDLFEQNSRYAAITHRCANCDTARRRKNKYVLYDVNPSSIESPLYQSQDYTVRSVSQFIQSVLDYQSDFTCIRCEGNLQYTMEWLTAPMMLPVKMPDGNAGSLVLWDREIMVFNYTYRLRGLIYYGSFHFTCRIVDELGRVWYADGMTNHGKPALQGNIQNMSQQDLVKVEGRSLTVALYMLSN